MTDARPPIGSAARWLALATTVVVSGCGLLALLTGHAPARTTRFGWVPAMDGADAQVLGAALVLLGLLPMMLWMRTPRRAAALGGIVGGSLLVLLAVALYG